MDITYENTIASILWLQFSDEETGKEARDKVSEIFHEQISQSWTPIYKIVRTFKLPNSRTFLSNVSIERYQFPVIQASALSMHKYQGKTAFNGLVLDFESQQPVPALHYMSLSRCPREEDNYIVGSLYAHQIKANEKAIQEMERLAKDAQSFLELLHIEVSVFGCIKA